MATTLNLAGLSDAQNEALVGVKEGDFIQFIKLHEQQHVQSDEDSETDMTEGDSASESGEDGEEDDEGEHDEMVTSVHGSVRDSESDEEDSDEEDSDGEDSAEAESGEGMEGTEETLQDSDSEDSDEIDFTTLFYVQRITQSKGLTEIKLIKLEYTLLPDDDAIPHNFQIYGDSIRTEAGTRDCSCEGDCNEAPTLEQLDEDFGISGYVLRLNPSTQQLRNTIAAEWDHDRCPAGCDEGVLYTVGDLEAVLSPATYTTTARQEYPFACPVCLGLDLLDVQQKLRTQLETVGGSAELYDAVLYMDSEVNVARSALGYHFRQHDERPWGYDHGLEEGGMMDEYEQDDGYGGGFHGYEQASAAAMDPNAAAVCKPASKTAVAALPRTIFETIAELEEDRLKCTVCVSNFEVSEEVVTMPCAHLFHIECLSSWMVQGHECPNCRYKLAAAVDDEDAHTVAQTGAGKMGGLVSAGDGADITENDEGNMETGSELEDNSGW
ncbi:hypothetical protein LTR97_000909 [Elasticomyces elasticus]|uniref:RING-type domain-containing protein n=1 Tax=Elasticomyces elasticus TaxID=574655 RepID=A0AAN7VYW0_9PEZI|nr:hypothetical protein LTR97_000909 [Elasticomyces elasticus]